MLNHLRKRFQVIVLYAAAVAISASPCLGVVDELESLKLQQQKIQQVIKQNSAAVVCVSDGVGFGSGVIVSEDGLVLTAGHVMASPGTEYSVILPSGRELKARPLGKNRTLDAGMVQITEKGKWPFVELARYESVDLGDWCICLGHPGGFELGRTAPVRLGRVLALHEFDIVTDCALIGGDSGGPLFDIEGRLIGIHSSIGNHIAINRHVSVNTFREYWGRILAGDRWGTLPDLNDPLPKKARRPSQASIGITLKPSESAATVIRVKARGAAERAGIRVGDSIIEFENQSIGSSKQLVDLIRLKRAGDRVNFVVQRGDKKLNLSAFLDQKGNQ